MVQQLKVTLNMAEIAAIAQRSFAEQITGQGNGVWTLLWDRIQALIEKEKGQGKKRPAA